VGDEAGTNRASRTDRILTTIETTYDLTEPPLVGELTIEPPALRRPEVLPAWPERQRTARGRQNAPPRSHRATPPTGSPITARGSSATTTSSAACSTFTCKGGGQANRSITRQEWYTMSKYKPDGVRPTAGDHDPLLECPSCACVYHPARDGADRTNRSPGANRPGRSPRQGC
jgi:hypothetical protein